MPIAVDRIHDKSGNSLNGGEVARISLCECSVTEIFLGVWRGGLREIEREELDEPFGSLLTGLNEMRQDVGSLRGTTECL